MYSWNIISIAGTKNIERIEPNTINSVLVIGFTCLFFFTLL